MPPDSPRTARSKPAWRSWPRMNSAMTRRATSVSMASSAGSSNGHGRSRSARSFALIGRRPCADPGGASARPSSRTRSGAAARSAGTTSRPGSASGSAVESAVNPARSATIRDSSRTWSSGPLVAQQRQRDPFAPDVAGRDVDDEQALVVERGAEERAPRSARSPRSRPRTRSTRPRRPGCRTRRTTSSAGRRSRISVRHDVAVPRPTSLVAARSRPGDEDTLIRIWAPSRARSLGHAEVPEVLADGDPDADSSRDGTARSTSPGREEAPLVEQPVGRQVQLPVDVPDLAVLDERGGDEQAVVGRFLDERHDRGQSLGRLRRVRPAAGRRGASRPR